MDDMKILCTGNPDKDYTLASCVRATFPNTTFIYKSNGFDLTTDHGLNLFRKEILTHNVFFNCSYVAPGVQTSLVTIAHEVWQKGRIFNMGSLVEYKDCNIEDQEYADSKKKLRNQAITLCSDNFKITHMTIDGYKFQNDLTSLKMPVDSIVKTIEWILFKKEFCVPFIVIMSNNTHNRTGLTHTDPDIL